MMRCVSEISWVTINIFGKWLLKYIAIPPLRNLGSFLFTPPPTPIPAMLTAQACNRFHDFCFDGSLTPRTIGQHCIKGGGGEVQTDPKFRKGVGAS